MYSIAVCGEIKSWTDLLFSVINLIVFKIVIKLLSYDGQLVFKC